MQAKCINLDLQCAALCYATAQLLTLDSEFADDLCKVCANVCNACAEECEKHAEMGMKHCELCAEACRKCAEACSEMVAA
ncbi:four-helix bundle copper-binding protein [Dyadobacter koreensis]|nr:four-helix bundle copper-binding protein [Dyadobacter koreensis]